LNDEKKEWIIKEDEKVKINLFFGEDPFAIGHIVIELKTSKHDISELEGDDWDLLKEWVPKVTKAMKNVLREFLGRETVKLYLCSFNESTNYPVHFHLVPRYECETLKGPDLLFYRSKASQIVPPSSRDLIVREMKKKLD
jgi:diadenosine tetraphosphate (Ap4A) HIT family hydrolase